MNKTFEEELEEILSDVWSKARYPQANGNLIKTGNFLALCKRQIIESMNQKYPSTVEKPRDE